MKFLPIMFCIMACCHGASQDLRNYSPQNTGLKKLALSGVSATVGQSASVDIRGDYSVEVLLLGEADTAYGPLVMWVERTSRKPVQIDSISAVNHVLSKLAKNDSDLSVSEMSDWTISLLRRQYSIPGQVSGITIFGTFRAHVIDRLKELMPERRDIVEKMIAPEKIISGSDWSVSWIEIDRLGGAERVLAKGSTLPWRVKNVSREEWIATGTLPPEVLSKLSAR